MLLDEATIEVECPRCRFFTPVFFRQIRLNDAVICCGCKTTLHLIDHLGQANNSQAAIEQALQSVFSDIKLEIKL